MKLNDLKYEIDPYKLILELKEELKLRNRSYFKDVIDKSDKIVFTCPYHKNGQESTPSATLRKTSFIHNGKEYEAGTVGCFACKETSSFTAMIGYLLTGKPIEYIGLQWIIKKTGNVYSKYVIEDKLKTNEQKGYRLWKQNQLYKNLDFDLPIIEESELEKYRYTHSYLYKRGLTDEQIEEFDIGIDNNFKSGELIYTTVTFPIKDLQGNVRAIIRRVASSQVKRFFIPETKTKPIWGLYECLSKLKENEPIYLCEGIFDSLHLLRLGLKSCSLVGVGSNFQAYFLSKMPQISIINIVFDGDEAGINGAERFKKMLEKQKSEYITKINIIYLPQGKDPDECNIDILNKGMNNKLNYRNKY